MAQDSLAVKNYALTRLTMTPANTQVSVVLTADRPLMIRVSIDDLTSTARISFTDGGTATGRQIFQGAEWRTPGFQMGQKTLYAESPNGGAILVIETWQQP